MAATKPREYPGRPVAAVNKATIQALKRAEERMLEVKNAGHTLAVDILDEFMHLFAKAARARRPMLDEDRKDLNPLGSQEEFEKYAKLTVDTAAQLAKYQSPTFRAITVAPPPPQRDKSDSKKRFTLTIFDGSGRKAIAHVSPIANANGNGSGPVTIDADPIVQE